MENKNDVINLIELNNSIHIQVNGSTVIELNESNNKIETIKIFEKLNICENYKFDLEVGNNPKIKELLVLFKYTKEFLTKLHEAVENINYKEINEQLIQ